VARLVAAWSLARLWHSWGVRPAALWEPGGPSPIAECLADGCSLEEGLTALMRGDESRSKAAAGAAGTIDLLTGPRLAWPDDGLVLRLSVLDWNGLLDAVCRLHVRGVAIDWAAFHNAPHRRVELPTYPFQRQRCWVERRSAGNAQVSSTAASDGRGDLVGRRLSLAGSTEIRYESRLSSDSPAYLRDHRIRGQVVLPATAYLEMALRAGGDQFGPAVTVEAAAFEQPWWLAEGRSYDVQLALAPGSADRLTLVVYGRTEGNDGTGSWVRYASARIGRALPVDPSLPALEDLRRNCGQPLALDVYYRALGARGLEFGESFRGIAALWKGPAGALGHIRLPAGCGASPGSARLHPALLDACSQVVAAALAPAAGGVDLYMLVGVDRLVSLEPAGAEAWCHARPGAATDAGPDRYCADLTIYDPRGRVIATILGLTYQRIAGAGAGAIPGRAGAREGELTRGNGHTSGRLAGRLAAASAHERVGLLEAHVRQEVARILGMAEWPDPGRGFFELGMDSLSASELVSALHRELGRTFPTTVLFERSNAGDLARYLHDEVLAGPAGGNGHPPGTDTATAGNSRAPSGEAFRGAALDGLSVDEMAGLFARMLDDLKGPTG
jgi:acyl transferase domain-containing protein